MKLAGELEMVPVRGELATVAFRRSTRARKISLRIDPAQGGIVITLPPRASRRAGLQLLRAHEEWVAEKLRALPQPLRLAPGALVPVGGVAHEIAAAPGSSRAASWSPASRNFWSAA
jgi:predicted metal-dependent hydrolase